MEMPRQIWAYKEKGEFLWATIPYETDTKYIRSDLVDKLKGYAEHDRECDTNRWNGGGKCDCGLTEVLKEIENG